MADLFGETQRLRRLLPQPPDQPRPSTPAQAKRQRIKQACEACRQSKHKCSGDLPKCELCNEKEIQCRYVATAARTRLHDLQRKCKDLQSRSAPYEALFNLLKSVSEQEALGILSRLRSGTDIEELLSHITDGDLLLQLSVVPETKYRYEFPYIMEMPANLLTRDNPYLQSMLYEAAEVYPSFKRSEPVAERSKRYKAKSKGNSSCTSTDIIGSVDDSIYLKPFHAAEVMDSRIEHARISHWTSVCDDDVLMRDLLRKWLHCEYQFTAAFQKDLFLDDLVDQRDDFCSPLLVNIVLGYSCVCYLRFEKRAEYWNPQTLTYRFVAEAKRLWELEANKPKITTIQAGILFNVFYNLSGLDEVGQVYRVQAIALAQDLRLFDSTAAIGSPRVRHGTAYTAWTLFNWETLVGFSFMFAPLLTKPPSWELPDPEAKPAWYGEILTKYPLSNNLQSVRFSHIFHVRSHFRVLMNEACQIAYLKDSEMTIGAAYDLYRRLRHWYDHLPYPLTPRAIVLPGDLQLHMYYHHLIITIFKPLLESRTKQDPSPQQIVASSTRDLQILVRLYYLRHGFEAMDLFIVIPLMLAATECIDAINEHTPPSDLETLRSTLILVTTGLFAQRRNHYLARALFRVIRGRMRPAEVALFRGIMNIDADQLNDEPDMAPAVRSHWPVTVVKTKEEVEAYILTNLVENYAHLNVD